jgi:hypothetical protein
MSRSQPGCQETRKRIGRTGPRYVSALVSTTAGSRTAHFAQPGAGCCRTLLARRAARRRGSGRTRAAFINDSRRCGARVIERSPPTCQAVTIGVSFQACRASA